MRLFSPAARRDLDEIVDYLLEAGASVETALAYGDDIERLTLLIHENPRIGRERSELHPGLRSCPVRSHIVLYRAIADQVQIVRILHGHRDISQRHFSP